jgi:hypothetical protein
MSPVCQIVADAFESRSGIIDALRNRGVEVEIRRLPVADYDLAAGILVERKTIPDFQLSLERGRLWRQVADLRNHARLPYLLLEGRDLDTGRLSGSAVRGACLAVIGQGVPVIASTDSVDSAVWLHLLALRGNGARLPRDRPAYAQRLKPRSDQIKEAMLAAVPGISTKAARARAAGARTWDGILPTETLIAEWPPHEDEPSDYWLSNLPPGTALRHLVRLAKIRWRIEHDYRELKHGLGLGHYEGRTWRGWHHHLTLVTAAQAFLTLRRHDPKPVTPV